MRPPAWLPLLPLLLLAALSPAIGHNKCDKAECAALKEKIRTIESKMRSGYTRAQGERFETRLRELRAKRYKICR
ncbi:MAG: hypothetical protein OER22_01535 [Gammaproteobacteria bacterium]|nr:hypothetical protein [Gammaproteobacteria bacterium]MDH3374346.1 hypothetical protein [Gammaproteobacteria bacterium]MDH3409911.1 hypothetical protein [Gammaproteobacteria bacterium]MDH3551275.1 hypothetical protein [Gammaproteobacteria bacterium]